MSSLANIELYAQEASSYDCFKEIDTYSGAYPFNFRWRIQSQNRVK